MTYRLTPEGYVQTKAKIADLQARLAALQARTDVAGVVRDEAERSFRDVISQYLRELKLYEADHPEAAKTA